MIERNTVHCMDYLDLLRQIPDGLIDAVTTDAPYGLKLDTWDNPIDIPAFIAECDRVLKPDSFLAFTIQMPYMVAWIQALAGHKSFKYVEHIVWLKRLMGAYSAGLSHQHESILIYRKGKARFFDTRGRYSDVRIPGIMFDALSIDGFQRVYSAAIGTNKPAMSGNGDKAHLRRGLSEPPMRAVEYCNFTNVWSFLPQNSSERNNRIEHPSVKPIKLWERLVSVVSPEGGLVLDPFSGSGTTALACRNTGRDYIVGDNSPEYVQLIHDRLGGKYDRKPSKAKSKAQPVSPAQMSMFDLLPEGAQAHVQ